MKTSANYSAPTSFILIGPPGSGKSTLAAQFPGVFMLDCDHNLSGPARYLKDKPPFFHDTPLFDADGKPVPPQLQFQRACRLLEEAAAHPDVKTLVVDSLTTFSDMALYEVMREQGRKIGDFNFPTAKSMATDDAMQMQDWGKYLGLMKKMIFLLKASGKTIIFTAHIKTQEDDITKVLRQAVAVPGQLSGIISGLFSEVWLLERETKRTTNGPEEVYSVVTFPKGAIDQGLGLKSSVGIKSGTKINPQELMKQLFPA